MVARYPTLRDGLIRVAAVAATSDLNLQAHRVCMHGTRQGLALGAPICLLAMAATWGLKRYAHDNTRHRQQDDSGCPSAHELRDKLRAHEP